MSKNIPKELRIAAVKELSDFRAALESLAQNFNVPSHLVFRYVGMMPMNKHGKFSKWHQFQRKHFSVVSASRRSSNEIVTVPSCSTIENVTSVKDAVASLADASSSKVVIGRTMTILSEMYKHRTPEEDNQLTVAAEAEQQSRSLLGLKRKRSSVSKQIEKKTRQLAQRHLEQVNIHMNILHSSFSLHSFLVVAGEGFETMVTGTLVNPSLPYIKIFSKAVMSLNEFRNKLESVVTLGDAAMKSGLSIVLDGECAGRSTSKAKPMQEIRMKELGDTLRSVFGK
jgi:hypothetical protein